MSGAHRSQYVARVTRTRIPELDLSRIGDPSAPWPFRVLDVLADGIAPADAASAEQTAQFFLCGDDDTVHAGSTLFYRRASGERVELPMRKMREIWPLALARGVVPPSWVDASRRVFPVQDVRFYCEACRGYGAVGWDADVCRACDGRGSDIVRGTVPVPGHVAWSWMLACPEVVVAAEELAREAVRRLDGAPKPQIVQWGRYDQQRPHGRAPLVVVSGIAARALVAHPDHHAFSAPAFKNAAWWSTANQRLRNDTLPILLRDVADARACRARGDMASAFEPVLRLWELGFLVEEILEDRIVLERAVSRPIV